MGLNTIELTKHQLIELYQYLDLFANTYDTDDSLTVGQMKAVLKDKYACRVKGGDIAAATNPRGAGRSKKYSEKTDNQIINLKEKGYTIRSIAEQSNSSIGYVENVLHRKRRSDNNL